MDMTAAQDKEVELSEVQVEVVVDGDVVVDEEINAEPTSEIKLVAEVDVDVEVKADIDVTVGVDAPLVGGDGDDPEELDDDEVQLRKANKAVASIVFTINRFILFCCFVC